MSQYLMNLWNMLFTTQSQQSTQIFVCDPYIRSTRVCNPDTDEQMPEFFRKLQNDITQKNNKTQNDFLINLLVFIDTNIHKLLDNA